ncbi:MAG: CBS domain-containing protein [Holosporales bacterium]|jgi:CBS domain containing-hemolysin-like protein|nr:CBS domain-containing protein [Holosporales bacterium]
MQPLFNKIKNIFSKSHPSNKDIVNEALDDFMEETTPEGEEINPNEKLMLSNVLCLRDLAAEDIMVPRAEIVAVEYDISFANLVKTFSGASKSQIPVYKDNLDNIVGVVSIRDILQFFFSPKKFDIGTIIQEAAFIAPSIKLDELLEQMRLTGKRLMLVVDEFGGIDGLVTLAEVVLKVLGSIQQNDEVATAPALVQQQDGSYLIDARTPIEEAEKALSTKFVETSDDSRIPDVETVGGLIISIANRVPSVGEIFNHHSGITFEVVDSDLRRVRRVIARLPD